ncbi:conserved repeat domain protein, partial [Rhodobacter ferrooxidans]
MTQGLLALIMLASVLIGGTGQAQAQDVNWVLSLSDAGSDPVAAGGTIAYTMSVTNDGFDAAPPTSITLQIPANTRFTGATGSITGCAPTPSIGPSSVTCNVPPLAPSAVATLSANLLTSVSGDVFFSASVPPVGDTDPADNDLTEQTTITAGADVGLVLRGPATASAGEVISYSFAATNNGPDPVTDLVLQFPIPSGVTNVVAPAGCVLTATTYDCTIPGPVAVGASVNVDFTGQISAASGSTVTAIGSVGAGNPSDPIDSNDNASLNTSVTAGSDLTIAKSRSPSGSLLVGNPAVFTLTPSYTGDSPNGIVVTDSIPANYTIDTVTAPGWICTVTGQVVECSRTTGSGAGANVPLGPISIATTVATPGTPTNTTSITAAGPDDPVPGNNSATDGGATIEEPVVDLQANKSGPFPALVVVGNSYDFTISTSNVGNAAFFGTLEMTDTLPAGLTVTAYAENGWTCTPAVSVVGPASILCSRVYTAGAPLAAGATTPSVTLTTTATTAGSVVNTMSVLSPDSNLPEDPLKDPLILDNNTTTYAVSSSEGPDSADISVIKSATLASLNAGEVQTFTIEVVNNGPVVSTDVEMTDNLQGLINSSVGAAGAGYISDSFTTGAAGGISCSTAATGGTSRELSCVIDTLPICTAGVDCPVFTVQVRPGGDGGARTNTASAISQTVPDSNLGNNADSAPFTLAPRVDVAVSKADSPDPAAAGQNLTYVITAQNLANGLSTATGVTITDTLPLNVTFVSASPSSGTCGTTPPANSTTTAGSRTVSCVLGSIGNGAQQTVTVIVRPNLITRNTTLQNDVAYSGAVPDIETGNDTASATTFVSPPRIDLIVNKDDTVDPLPIGDDTTYLVTVANLGPSSAENVLVTDTMPPSRLTYQSHVATGATCNSVPALDSLGQTLACTFPVIPAGESRTISITARGVAKGVGLNSVSVSSAETALGYEPNTGNNSTTEQTSIRTRADMEVASKTATPATVNLRDPFSYLIVVENNTGTGLAEADDVVVSDTLPSGMQLSGAPTVSVISGTTTTSTCTGASGSTSFTCALGTVSSGAVVHVTVPARIVTVTALGQTFTNTASVSTSSLDVLPGNNSNSGPVVANSSSLSGTVFRDFAANGTLDGSDTGIVGVTMTLTGTALDGTPVSRTVTTGAGGAYAFDFLPEGTYSISQGAISESYLTNGATAAGPGGGTPAPTQITAIPLLPATASPGYIFPKVPQARVAIAKAVQAGPMINADGSYNVTFRLRVQNPSLEGLTNVAVTDPLEGAAPLFGTYVALAAPTVPGTYTMVAAPSGSCGGLNGGFTGAGPATVASGFAIAAGATCTIDLQLRVQPTQPLPPLTGAGRYLNQATVDAQGVLSGQTSASNPQLTDLSDNGTSADANGNGRGNEAGENDPTPVTPVYNPAITLTKAIDLSVLPSPIAADSPISFTFTVTNSGNITLTDVTLSDALAGAVVTGGPITLAPGQVDSTSFTATYPLSAADLTANTLSNTATATGTWGLDAGGNPQKVSDPDTVATSFADIALVKAADASLLSVPPQVGDIISYDFAVTNTGNVPLTNVTLSDILTDAVLTGGPIPSLAVGATDSSTFTATYALTQADIDAGEVINRATADGVYGTDDGGDPISVQDESGANVTEDADTVVPLTQAPRIELIKSLSSLVDTTGDGQIGAGDTANYGFTVTNTGNVALAGVTVSDLLVSVSGGPVSLAIGATDSTSFTAAYVLTQADVDRGYVQNTATATGAAVTSSGDPILD